MWKISLFIMEIRQYIKEKKELYSNIIDFIENESDDDDDHFFDYIKSKNINDDKNEFELFLLLISRISVNHFINRNISNKIEKILSYFKDPIKQTFSNSEIFNIFIKDKRTLLYLVNERIITIDGSILQIILDTKHQKMQFCSFFYPEIKNMEGNDTFYFPFEENFDLKKFENNRKIGQNDSYICELIRNDSVEEFIQYVNKTNYSLESKIERSFYETNYFLIKNEPSLIEYAAFFGSIQILNYLRYSKVDLNPSLWVYSIHSSNPDLIHLLEENDVEPPKNEKISFRKCLKESIKCHHNNIFIYINDNLMVSNNHTKIQKYCYRFYNYQFLTDDLNETLFPHLCKYQFFNLVKLFLKNNEIKSLENIILIFSCF